MKLRVICCEIFYREACHLVAVSPHTCDLDFLPKGLHDLGVEKMLQRIQERLDLVQEGVYDAVLLAYGLCNNGIVGLKSAHTRVVIPKAHDCISLFMGSRKRYQEYFNAHPGTYYRTSGWIERSDASGAGDATISQKLGLFMKYEELVRLYGEENAQYVMEQMGDGTANYDQLTYISVGLEGEDVFRQEAIRESKEKGWKFDDVRGSLELLRKLIDGQWDDNFVVLEPGLSVRASHDEHVIKVG